MPQFSLFLKRVAVLTPFCFFLFSVPVQAKKNKIVAQTQPRVPVVFQMPPGGTSREQALRVRLLGSKQKRATYKDLTCRFENALAPSAAVFSLQGLLPARVRAGDTLDVRVLLSLNVPSAEAGVPLPSYDVRSTLVIEGVPLYAKKKKPILLSRVDLVGVLPPETSKPLPAALPQSDAISGAPLVQQPLPVAPPLLPIQVKRSGSGRVVSTPDPWIACGPLCTATQPKGSSVVIEAIPRAGFVLKNWGETPCKNTDAIGQKRCEVLLESPLDIRVRFDRTTKRKVLGGILGATAGGALVAAVSLFAQNGRWAGPDATCSFDGGIVKGECVYNTAARGWVSAGVSAGLGIAMAFTLWPPDIKK